MTIREYRQIFISRLIPVYGADEAESFFYLALESLTGMRRIDLALKPDTALSAESELAWNDVLSQLLQQVPIQYILGTTHFNGLEFKVTPAVLIPRPETEELVDWVVQSANIPNPSILDIGTGSGCIAISLAHRLIEATVSAMDVSADALQIAKYNADANHVKVNFILDDILQFAPHAKYDIIVSNPPYVRYSEKSEIRSNVLDNEPHLALFVADDDPLLFYRRIAELAVGSLNENGALFFEINQYLAAETILLLTSLGYQSDLRKDMYGNDRMVKAMLHHS